MAAAVKAAKSTYLNSSSENCLEAHKMNGNLNAFSITPFCVGMRKLP